MRVFKFWNDWLGFVVAVETGFNDVNDKEILSMIDIITLSLQIPRGWMKLK